MYRYNFELMIERGKEIAEGDPAFRQHEFLGTRMPIRAKDEGKLDDAQINSLKFQFPDHWRFRTVETGQLDITDPFQQGIAEEDVDNGVPLEERRVVHDIYAVRIPELLKYMVREHRSKTIK